MDVSSTYFFEQPVTLLSFSSSMRPSFGLFLYDLLVIDLPSSKDEKQYQTMPRRLL